MSAAVGRILTSLRRTKTLEDAATAVLGLLLERCSTGITELGIDARMKRSVLHLRSATGYQSLLLLEPDNARARVPEGDPAFLTSATAWREIQQHRRAVTIDERIGALTVMGLGAEGQTIEMESSRTLGAMRQRFATHLLVMPLVDLDGEVVGQISLEANASREIMDFSLWVSLVDELQALIDVAIPYLTRLPLEPSAEPSRDGLLPVIGPTMAPILRNLRAFASTEEIILLLGETGTGKSRLARWCHSISPRSNAPFEVLDLNAVPQNLQQAELFGWRKGTFTGATRDHEGAVQRAAGGTLFIDEIDKLSLETQAGLLRLLEDGQYRVLGERFEREANVRFVIGSNAHLLQAIAKGEFLRDLYYRINVLPVRLPSLAERKDEILGWARFMLERRAHEVGQTLTRLDDADLRPLLLPDWPGNLRQLNNVVRRVCALAQIDAEAGGGIVVSRSHVEHSLAMEQEPQEKRGLLSVLERSASAAALELIQRTTTDSRLDLDAVVGAFRALIILACIGQVGSIDEAFNALGKSDMVKSRNHQRALQNARARLEQLREMLER